MSINFAGVGKPRVCLVALAAVLAVGLLASADDRAQSLLCNTLLLAAGTCAVSLPIGTLIALAVVKTDVPGRGIVALGLGVLMFVPLYLQCAAWQAGFGVQGWWTVTWQTAPWLDGWRGAIWVHGMAAVPWVALVVGAGLWLVEPELEEQALLDGTPLQVLCRVTLNRAAAAILVAALWVTVTTAGEMTVTDLMRIRTYAEEVYTDFAAAGSLATGPAPFWLGVGLTGVLIVMGAVACSGLTPSPSGSGARARWRLPLGRWRWPVLGVMSCLCFLVLGVPLASLATKAGMVVTRVGDHWLRSWSFAECITAVAASPAQHLWELGWSLTIAVCAAVAVLFTAVLLAWLARGGRPVPLLVATAVALAVPGPVVGVAIIYVLNRPEIPPLVWLYDRSILAPWIAQAVRALPLPTFVMWHALATVPEEILDSAAAEGAGWFTRLVWVALPTRTLAVVGAVFGALIVALGELSATVLVVPPGMSTLPVRIFGLLHYGVEDQVAAVCLVVVAGIVLVAVVGWGVASASRSIRAW